MKRKLLEPEHRKTIIFTMRISPEQEQYLDYGSQILAEIFERSQHELSKGFVIQKLMEFGRADFEAWVKGLRKLSREERKKQIA